MKSFSIKMALGFSFLSLLFVPTLTFAELGNDSGESDNTATRFSRPSQKTNDPRTVFHVRRGYTGEGYTRFYGRRYTTGTSTGKNAARANYKQLLRNRYNQKNSTTVQGTNQDDRTVEYTPLRYFHTNRGQDGEGYTRFSGRRYSDAQRYNRASYKQLIRDYYRNK